MILYLSMLVQMGCSGAVSRCGNNVVDANEQCDGALFQGDIECRDFGFLRGELQCRDECMSVSTSNCESSSGSNGVCGDGILDPGEECDTWVPEGMDCERLGYETGRLACSPDCTLDRDNCADEDINEDDCDPHDYQRCYQGDVYWYDSCGRLEGMAENCASSEACVETRSNSASCEETCLPHDYQQCYSGDVYWFDSCGGMEEIAYRCTTDEICTEADSTTASCESTCTETDYWSPDRMSASKTEAESGTTLEVEIRDANSGGNLEFKVCKGSGTFSNDINVYFAEWVRYSGKGIFSDDLRTSGDVCSAWEKLSTSSWNEGDGLGGNIQIVSPDYCSSTWGWSCSESASTCGTCWFISTSIMYRTCME